MVGRRKGYIRVLPGREKFLALYYLRHVSFPTFPASTSLAATATVLSIIVHSGSGRRQSPLVGPRRILLLFRFHRSYRRLHTRRHCRRPWRVKHFLRVGGSKSTTPPPFCLQHELGIYLSDLLHSLPPPSPPFVFTMLIVLLFVLFERTYILYYTYANICAVCVFW